MILRFPRAKHGLCHYNIWGDPSVIRYSSKTAEQNFMKLSGIVHYMVLYTASPILSFIRMILGFPTTKDRLCRMRGYQPLIFF